MRLVTETHKSAMAGNRVYCLILHSPPPDLSKVKRDALTFSRWISTTHKRELARRPLASKAKR